MSEKISNDDTLECPVCSSTRIAVPWEVRDSDSRKRMIRVFFILWATYSFWWLLFFFVRSDLVWMLPLMVYVVATFTLASDFILHLGSYHCAACGHWWKRKHT